MLKEGVKIHPEMKMNRLVYSALTIDSKSWRAGRAHQTVHVCNCCKVNRNKKKQRAGGEACFHSATENQTISVLLLLFFFQTTLAGSAVLHINKSFFAVGFLCAAGAAVSAERFESAQ